MFYARIWHAKVTTTFLQAFKHIERLTKF